MIQNWAELFDIFDSYSYVVWLDGFVSNVDYGSFPSLIMASDEVTSSLPSLSSQSHTAGFVSYTFKDALDQAYQTKSYETWFPDFGFLKEPMVLSVKNSNLDESEKPKLTPLEFNFSVTKSEYMEAVEQIKHEIQVGNLYETNYCIQLESNTNNHPVDIYKYHRQKAKAPFGALVKWNNLWCLCFSPERFLKKKGHLIHSQPIKGSAQRVDDVFRDKLLQHKLLHSEKDIAENTMVVDLVRNDMSQIAIDGSVVTTEYCKLYSFQSIHHLISTVEARVPLHIEFKDMLQALFPMGSMTGAPKINAVKIAAKYESFSRDLFSGTIGYIDPNGDFDFNVIIRSLFIDTKSKKVKLNVGSGITTYSIPEEEWLECLIKINRWL